MTNRHPGPFASPRTYGTIIVVSTEGAPIPMGRPLRKIAHFIAAGTGLRVGVIQSAPLSQMGQRIQPAETLLAASNGAAGRMLGVAPARRLVNQPPGVDWFAPRLRDALTPPDWEDIYQEARLSRGVLIVIDPVIPIYRDITLNFAEEMFIEECGRKCPYPDDPDDWKPIGIMLLHTMLAVRALFAPPCDAFGMEAIFGSPLT